MSQDPCGFIQCIAVNVIVCLPYLEKGSGSVFFQLADVCHNRQVFHCMLKCF